MEFLSDFIEIAAYAPGRVNLIGEHTDYTGGYVMPMAIDFGTECKVKRLTGSKAEVRSGNFTDAVAFDLDAIPGRGRRHWSDYPIGVAWALKKRGINLPGFSMELKGNVPLGAGLSSSASVEVATAVALLHLAAVKLAPSEVAKLCREAENEFAGGACGIMDQFAVTCGVSGHALLLDCRSLEYELLALPEMARVVICNSMVKHQVAGGEYGNRREEVEAGQAVLAQNDPEISLLRDADLTDLERWQGVMGKIPFKRCRHIVTENGRVMEAREALRANDLSRFGTLMYEAHASFRDDFEASCTEVDALVELARTLPGCYGARITGGGFGGCTVNLVAAEEAERFRECLVAEYKRDFGVTADCYITRACDGAMA